nr:MAG TPA: hypothetical protein [Crassvirales sp.]
MRVIYPTYAPHPLRECGSSPLTSFGGDPCIALNGGTAVQRRR